MRSCVCQSFKSFMSLDISLVQLNFFLLTLVDNLVTYIKNENFKNSL